MTFEEVEDLKSLAEKAEGGNWLEEELTSDQLSFIKASSPRNILALIKYVELYKEYLDRKPTTPGPKRSYPHIPLALKRTVTTGEILYIIWMYNDRMSIWTRESAPMSKALAKTKLEALGSSRNRHYEHLSYEMFEERINPNYSR